MTQNTAALLQKYRGQLQKALSHVDYSARKAASLKTDPNALSEEQLETWEGLIARFSRATDIFVNKYLRLCVLHEDPTFHGTLRDLLNFGERIAVISDARKWLAVRELRNRAAHEYVDEQLEAIFVAVRSEVPFVCSEIRQALVG